MEELEPWNMFTNDFVSDDADANKCSHNEEEIGEEENETPYGEKRINDFEGNQRKDKSDEGEQDGAAQEDDEEEEAEQDPEQDDDDNDEEDEENSNFLIPEVTMGGDGPQSNSNSNGDNDDQGEADSTIFNFGLEPLKSNPLARSRRSPTSGSTEDNRTKKELESLIIYDDAIVHICPACGTEYETNEEWKRHMNGVHSFNTRRGLNFVQIDKLYHECQECYKRIAMHSMENLLKHKYTHLPYRCSKCRFCQRQYKYRQDLMVHLRTQHYDDLIEGAKVAKEVYDKQEEHRQNNRSLEIREIKENAVDIFENTMNEIDPSIQVKKEKIDPEENDEEQSRNSFILPAFLEDALSRGSSHNSEQQNNGEEGNTGNNSAYIEKQIQYICPDCGQEYGTQNQWQQHIVSAHDFGTHRGLNFEEINSNQQAQCLECEEIVLVNDIHNLQQHKFTHLPHKFWLRCKMCFRAFSGRAEIMKHLIRQHKLGPKEDTSNVSVGNGDDESQDSQRAAKKKKKTPEHVLLDKNIDYLCPACGKEFRDKKLWRKHLVHVHKLTSLEILNFKVVNEREVQCNECGKIITNAYGLQNAQQHYFIHMPFKSFIRCRVCGKSYTDRKGLVKHLRGKHYRHIFLKESHQNESSHNKPFGKPPQLQPLRRERPEESSMQRNQLLSKALKRPLPNPQFQSAPKRTVRRKEIVTRNNYIYEIEYLDDSDDDDENGTVGIVNAAMENNNGGINDDDDDILLVPEITSNINGNNRRSSYMGRERCPDCGSIFSNPEALRAHIRKEHDFYDKATPTTTTQPQISNSNFINSNSELSNDDTLLIPTSSASTDNYNTTAKSSSNAPVTSGPEGHFTYLCPACGVEHYSQLDWRRHINGVHNFDKRQYLNFRQLDQLRYQCTICQDIISKSKLKTLQDHKFRHLPYKSYLKCKHCGTLYNHKPNMYGHLQVRHNIYVARAGGNGEDNGDDYPAAATTNSNRFTSQSNSHHPSPAASTIRPTPSNVRPTIKPPGLKTVEDVIAFHNAVDHASISYFCPSCNENFEWHVLWRKHIVEEHNLNSREGLNFRQIDDHHYLCLQCYKRVTVTHTKGAIGQLQSHKFRHLPYKSFKCLDCNGEFVRKQMFFKHLNRVTNRCDGVPQVSSTASTSTATTATTTSTSAAGTGNKADNPLDKSDATPVELIPSVSNKSLSISNISFTTSSPYSTTAASTSMELDEDLRDSIRSLGAFIFICPQCGVEFDTQRSWREHINIEHSLGKRENLFFKKLKPDLHKCLECDAHVNGRKLRDLQMHRFHHLPFRRFVRCKICSMGYNTIRNLRDHLRQKHPNAVPTHDEHKKMEDLRSYEENSSADGYCLEESQVVNEAELNDESHEMCDEVDDDEQYLLS